VFYLSHAYIIRMDKDEYSHLHGYEDAKEAFNEKLDARADTLYQDMWDTQGSVLEAFTESLAQSSDYATMVMYCNQHNNPTLLGSITLELIDVYLSEKADEMAEDEL